MCVALGGGDIGGHLCLFDTLDTHLNTERNFCTGDVLAGDRPMGKSRVSAAST